MGKKIELVDIVSGNGFLREIRRAAAMSYNHNKESGFCVYTDEDFSKPYINEAVLGEEHSASSDMVEGHEHEPKKGYHIPPMWYRLIHLHFHPPKSDLHPSKGDIADCLDARIANRNLRDFSSEFQKSIYEGIKLIGYEVDYANPVSIICLVRDKPEDIELLVYQGITEEPILFEDFCKFVADYCNKLYGGEKWKTEDVLVLGFPTRFKSTKRVVEFLNASNYFQAVDVRIRNGKLSAEDLEKLGRFHLIQTRFFPEKIYYLEDDYLDGF